MSNSLEQLRRYTTVVSDSGDFESVAVYKPQDATTNPSLILAAVKNPSYARLIDVAVEYAKHKGGDSDAQVQNCLDRLLVEFGKELLNVVPGRVSTEADPALSFDKEKTKSMARHLIALYKEIGIDKERVLIKIASTWEGIQAARDLEKEGIHCNLTLLFGLQQAVACAEAGVTLISPFVGRILDWYQKERTADYAGAKDPGVQAVTRIYNYYKQHGYDTIVMAASLRSVSEAIWLAGCDFLTIPVPLLKELQGMNQDIPQVLSPEKAAQAEPIEKLSYIDDEPAFRWSLASDAMAQQKLNEGILKFNEDATELKSLLRAKLES
ncbi:hypothetical protein BMF94_1767 [Rhodotorula taiwanensis]|uniref:Transaldolase n=1 Tax=Rhodotorula taiwanensis TaxID=741276 RepID=A0A2S5BEC6_9BASI|nr:hypothetical protein BMF94_1767 [Rhodotorula taiwanensis]